MKRTEKIDGIEVVIDWEFMEVCDRLDHNWVEWSVIGTDKDGNEYSGSCQADPWLHNTDFCDVADIEKL